MNKIFTKWSMYILLLIPVWGFAQTKVQLEIAPYTVPCDETERDNCLQLLSTTGSAIEVIPLDGIKGFKAEQGFEYTLDVEQAEENTDSRAPQYILKKEVSKMWVPQYAIDAPTLEGSFQVVGFNGRSIDNIDIDLVINSGNSIMRGSTGCNNYHLFFKQFGYSLVFSKILATHMFCSSRAALEEEYFVVFNNVHHFELKGDVLRLFDITDKNLLEAVRIR